MKALSTRTRSVTLALAAAAFAGSAQSATTYSLASDFSDVNNPNGVWSFTQGATVLAHHLPFLGNGNGLNPGVANGMWGTGPNLNTDVPFVAKTTLNGAAIGGLSNNDFLLGDVIAHSANTGSSLFVNWTAPAAGTISYSAAAWYAHSSVVRVNEVLVALDGVSQGATGLINNTSNRGAPVSFSGAGLAVDAGDVLSFEIRKEAAQSFGSITGLNATVDFTAAPVPEPATYGLMLVGLAAVGAAVRRRTGAQRG